MELVNFLRHKGTIDELKTKYFLKVRTHENYPNLHLFKYDMINSPFDEKIVQESRGIILDENDNWNIVSYPYDKFFNYEEKRAPKLDWDTSTVYEKLDGSLMTLYYYDNKWMVATSGTPDGSGCINLKTKNTFSYFFWKVWGELNYSLPTDTTKCYMFELLSQYNQIIVPQSGKRIVLHGVRCLKTLKEHNPFISKKYGWEIVQSFIFNSLPEAVETGKKLNPDKNEGYVICDSNFNRIKVKSFTYVQIAHMGKRTEKGNDINYLKIVQNNEGDEFLASFPLYKDRYDQIKELYNKTIEMIERELEKTREYKLGKELAMIIRSKWYSGCIFLIRSGKENTVKNWLSKRNPKLLISHL